MLEFSDFREEGESTVPEFMGTYKQEHGVYAIQMVRLAQIRELNDLSLYIVQSLTRSEVGRVLATQFKPNRDQPDKDETRRLITAVEEWKATLPANMRTAEMDNNPENIWTYLLLLGYK